MGRQTLRPRLHGLFTYPGYRFRAVDQLLTNFHAPGSSLLVLVSALAGEQPIRAAAGNRIMRHVARRSGTGVAETCARLCHVSRQPLLSALVNGAGDRSQPPADWAGQAAGELTSYVTVESEKTLAAYERQPTLVDEHANHEEDTARGGYAHRQLFELIQNSADALADTAGGGRIDIRLTDSHLYCADDGRPIDPTGVKSLMFSHLSPKRGTRQIGRFGLGFKSVLGVTDAPEFFSRAGSFRFDRCRSQQRIRGVAPDAARYPALRLPEPIDPGAYRKQDRVLRILMEWAANVVRLPLKPAARDGLNQQMRNFPPEFLLFVKHVRHLALSDDRSDLHRTLEVHRDDRAFWLSDGSATTRWKLFERTHSLSSDARADRRSLDDGDEVPIWWAAPLDRLAVPGHFWAFFPTNTASLAAGILNAPWKTNEDRQNLLSGTYNGELIEAAAEMIADRLTELATPVDVAAHLDALPRRREAGDSPQSELLRKHLFDRISEQKIVPDQDGDLHAAREIQYPPKQLTEGTIDLAPFEQWAASPGRPSKWLHHKALTRIRLATIDRLFDGEGEPSGWRQSEGAPRATIAQWLEALVHNQEPENAIGASKMAIRTAALLPAEKRTKKRLGQIVLTAAGDWQEPDPEHLFLGDAEQDHGHATSQDSPVHLVHPELASDRDVLAALKQLGIKPVSAEISFKQIAKAALSDDENPNEDQLVSFWDQARKVGPAARGIIEEHDGWESRLRIRTRSGTWNPLHSALLPCKIVPGDGTRDDDVTVDTEFHGVDIELLRGLGLESTPREGRHLSSEPWYQSFRAECEKMYRKQPLSSSPQSSYLVFQSDVGSGPLQLLGTLSTEGQTRYTEALLSLDATYQRWTMQHKTLPDRYPKTPFKSPALAMLRRYGKVRTSNGIVPLSKALGQQPESQAAWRALMMHPKVDRIREAFDLADPTPEFIGEESPVPLPDVWPGLKSYLPAHRRSCQLIRCERILVGDDEQDCVFHPPNVYLARTGDDSKERELRLVCARLELHLREYRIREILDHQTQCIVEQRRAAVRERSTDAERLLAAVGEPELKKRLPHPLLAMMIKDEGIGLTGVQIAEAVIATYHSDALRQCRDALERLVPPYRWAGSEKAVDFVHSLGFSAEWAGEQNRRRPPYLEIEGPYSLPELHEYQKIIVRNVRNTLCKTSVDGAERRGMISMPTGSGKTRVAVQAVVEAMCHDGLDGGILWVADRDELCEQAVEAWRQVWTSIGAETARLRISRMWAGQPRPQPTSTLHVIVATIQTLNAKLSAASGEYEFLADFKLVVFDEAHRSVAPTFTSVMGEIGLTRWKRSDEPFLLGLTATPYRGHDAEETARLVSRYGSNRLDAGAFASDHPQAVIGELQQIRVLARADHETIDGGVYSLDGEEKKQAASTPWLPRSVEGRIARDPARTERIIDAYERHVKRDWPTLIFATSVEHAQTVAALLNIRGVRSRAVSATTEPATRRRVVEDFRRGEIRALVNYGVFREGFDAPKTRAIIVARPVYSPNLYFQMIGRGLRGVKNGGNDRCLILNVKDNIENFQRSLAFSDLDWLWG